MGRRELRDRFSISTLRATVVTLMRECRTCCGEHLPGHFRVRNSASLKPTPVGAGVGSARSVDGDSGEKKHASRTAAVPRRVRVRRVRWGARLINDGGISDLEVALFWCVSVRRTYACVRWTCLHLPFLLCRGVSIFLSDCFPGQSIAGGGRPRDTCLFRRRVRGYRPSRGLDLVWIWAGNPNVGDEEN